MSPKFLIVWIFGVFCVTDALRFFHLEKLFSENLVKYGKHNPNAELQEDGGDPCQANCSWSSCVEFCPDPKYNYLEGIIVFNETVLVVTHVEKCETNSTACRKATVTAKNSTTDASNCMEAITPFCHGKRTESIWDFTNCSQKFEIVIQFDCGEGSTNASAMKEKYDAQCSPTCNPL